MICFLTPVWENYSPLFPQSFKICFFSFRSYSSWNLFLQYKNIYIYDKVNDSLLKHFHTIFFEFSLIWLSFFISNHSFLPAYSGNSPKAWSLAHSSHLILLFVYLFPVLNLLFPFVFIHFLLHRYFKINKFKRLIFSHPTYETSYFSSILF